MRVSFFVNVVGVAGGLEDPGTSNKCSVFLRIADMVHTTHFHTVSTLKTDFLVRRSTFDPGSVSMAFVVQKLVLLWGFLGVLYCGQYHSISVPYSYTFI
jgi:hypothetical protein